MDRSRRNRLATCSTRRPVGMRADLDPEGDMDIRLLGPVEVWADDGPIDIGGRRPRAVLPALAALHPHPETLRA